MIAAIQAVKSDDAIIVQPRRTLAPAPIAAVTETGPDGPLAAHFQDRREAVRVSMPAGLAQ